MKINNKVLEILNKYDLDVRVEIPNNYKNLYTYLRDNPNDLHLYTSEKNDEYFLKKFMNYIPDGWYGFELGTLIFPCWVDALDEILELCVSIDKDFQIHQIKMKYGGVRFYVESKIIEDINDISFQISNKMFNSYLIY